MPATPRLLETRSIDYVPWNERRGKVWHQGPFWFTSNFVLFTLAVGFTGPLGGLGLGWTTVAVALGGIVGTFFMAFHANQGPQLGIPQMIQSRAQFGTRGVLVALIAALFVYIGLNVFDLPMATQGLQAVTRAGPRWPWYIALVAVQAAIAIFGYDAIHFVQRWLTYVLIAVFMVLTVGAVVVLGGPRVLTMGAFNSVAFFSQCAAVCGYVIAYAIYVSDYLSLSSSGNETWTFGVLDVRRQRAFGRLAHAAGSAVCARAEGWGHRHECHDRRKHDCARTGGGRHDYFLDRPGDGDVGQHIRRHPRGAHCGRRLSTSPAPPLPSFASSARCR